jgi:hypothetical protein
MHGKRIATRIALTNQLSLSTNWPLPTLNSHFGRRVTCPQAASPEARPPWVHCRRGMAYRARRIGRPSDDRSKVDRRAPHKPNACHGSSGRSLVPQRDQTLLISRRDFKLLDCHLYRTRFIRRINKSDESSRRRLEADYLPPRLLIISTGPQKSPGQSSDWMYDRGSGSVVIPTVPVKDDRTILLAVT